MWHAASQIEPESGVQVVEISDLVGAQQLLDYGLVEPYVVNHNVVEKNILFRALSLFAR